MSRIKLHALLLLATVAASTGLVWIIGSGRAIAFTGPHRNSKKQAATTIAAPSPDDVRMVYITPSPAFSIDDRARTASAKVYVVLTEASTKSRTVSIKYLRFAGQYTAVAYDSIQVEAGSCVGSQAIPGAALANEGSVIVQARVGSARGASTFCTVGRAKAQPNALSLRSFIGRDLPVFATPVDQNFNTTVANTATMTYTSTSTTARTETLRFIPTDGSGTKTGPTITVAAGSTSGNGTIPANLLGRDKNYSVVITGDVVIGTIWTAP